MPSAARYAAVGVVGRPLPHVVRDAFYEGDEGIAEVRDQHRFHPSASAVREGSLSEIMQIVNCTGRGAAPWRLSEIMQIVNCTGRCCTLASL